MNFKLALASALGALVLASPALADPWRGDNSARGDGYSYDQRADFDRGDFGRGYRSDADMLRFREQRLERQLREAMSEGWLNRGEASWAWNEFRSIRFQTEREIGVHGPNLPNDDQRRILLRIQRLSQFLQDQDNGGDTWGRGANRDYDPGHRR
jgi:hypothetical protein